MLTYIHTFIYTLYTFIRLPVLYTVPTTDYSARYNVVAVFATVSLVLFILLPGGRDRAGIGSTLVNFLSNDSFGFNNKSNCFVKRFNRLLQFLYLLRRQFFPFPFSCRGFAACLFRRFVHVHVLASTKKV